MAFGFRKSRLSWSKQLRLMEHFVAGTTARTAAELAGVNPKTAAFYFHSLHQIIVLAEDKNHINGIENFWNQAKRHLRRFNGVPKENFPLFLRECEWRFNTPNPKLNA